MNHVETNEIGWAKDKILTKEIVRALSETEERDLIYTISVQPHGAYPEESETADIKVLSGIEDPALRGQMEYYATQVHEVDEFLRTLTDVPTTWAGADRFSAVRRPHAVAGDQQGYAGPFCGRPV